MAIYFRVWVRAWPKLTSLCSSGLGGFAVRSGWKSVQSGTVSPNRRNDMPRFGNDRLVLACRDCPDRPLAVPCTLFRAGRCRIAGRFRASFAETQGTGRRVAVFGGRTYRRLGQNRLGFLIRLFSS